METTGIIEQKLKDALRRAGLRGGSALLAVSGGPDSMALLEAASAVRQALGLHLEVATIDHGLRAAAQDEVAHVHSQAQARGLRCHEVRLGLRAGPGVEARARAARYAALENVREGRGLDVIATAHTASDQAETVLMRLARGSALGGAAAIREARGRVIRPLLGCTREEVLQYLRRRKVPWVEDPMNRDPAFLRVRIREGALPALEEAAGPGVARRLARFAAYAAEDDVFLCAQADAARERLTLPDGAVDEVGLRALLMPLRRRVLASLLDEAGLPVDAATLDRALATLAKGGRATLGRGAVLVCGSGRVRVAGEGAPGGEEPAERERVLRLDGPPLPWLPGGVELAWRSARPPGEGGVQPLPRAAGGLTVRTRRPGDRVRRADGRHAKLQDVLVDAKVPRERRDALPVLVDEGGQVVCVAGVWPRPGTRPGRGASFLVTRALGA